MNPVSAGRVAGSPRCAVPRPHRPGASSPRRRQSARRRQRRPRSACSRQIACAEQAASPRCPAYR